VKYIILGALVILASVWLGFAAIAHMPMWTEYPAMFSMFIGAFVGAGIAAEGFK